MLVLDSLSTSRSWDKLLHWAVAALLVARWVTSDDLHRIQGFCCRKRLISLSMPPVDAWATPGVLGLAQLVARLRRRRAGSIERDRVGWLAAAVHWCLPPVVVSQALLRMAAASVALWVVEA
jgi:hypothetical protein